MVKNIGGNRAKKLGRKFVNGGEEDSGVGLKTRFSQDPCEMYAAVTKEYGNGRCLVKCIDGVERSMVIRKKFKGRGKRGCYVKSGSWVLVGIRDWESRNAKSVEVCDLLEVYSKEDINYLIKNIDAAWFTLKGVGKVSNDDEDADGDIDNTVDVCDYNEIGMSDDEKNTIKKTSGNGQYITFSDDEEDFDGNEDLDLDDL